MCDHLLLLGSVKEKKISLFFFIAPSPLKGEAMLETAIIQR